MKASTNIEGNQDMVSITTSKEGKIKVKLKS